MGKDAVGHILGADGGFSGIDLSLFRRLGFVLVLLLCAAGFAAQIVLVKLFSALLFLLKGLLLLRGKVGLFEVGRYITAYEIEVNIINYSKTRDVYVAYRKAGYSKKFKAEHESEILLHQAAKKAFDELGLTKIPTVKSLRAEYAALLAEKKSDYADYRKARDEMRELLTVKANVDRILGLDEQEKAAGATRQEDER